MNTVNGTNRENIWNVYLTINSEIVCIEGIYVNSPTEAIALAKDMAGESIFHDIELAN